MKPTLPSNQKQARDSYGQFLPLRPLSPLELKQKETKSVQFYLNLIKNMGEFHRSTAALRKSGFGELTARMELGRYYFYFYDPKLKETLPMYDKFPLTIPMNYYEDGFLGLNLHYLSQGSRIQLHSRLMTLANDASIPEDMKIGARYEILKSTQKYRAFKPCIKRYLYNHIQSKFLNINPMFWEMALFLPVQQFRKGSPY